MTESDDAFGRYSPGGKRGDPGPVAGQSFLFVIELPADGARFQGANDANGNLYLRPGRQARKIPPLTTAVPDIARDRRKSSELSGGILIQMTAVVFQHGQQVFIVSQQEVEERCGRVERVGENNIESVRIGDQNPGQQPQSGGDLVLVRLLRFGIQQQANRRNGHRRWPEALELVEKFWRELPARYRYDRQLRRQDEAYPDFDCSKEGFEGIRSQDILPLALERFGFEFFYAFPNVTDPFVDRSYGPNFDAEGAWDREFIDRVHACDEAEIRAGRITPTHMLAVMGRERGGDLVCREHLTPAFCVRRG